jgi:hypothetical protein
LYLRLRGWQAYLFQPTRKPQTTIVLKEIEKDAGRSVAGMSLFPDVTPDRLLVGLGNGESPPNLWHYELRQPAADDMRQGRPKTRSIKRVGFSPTHTSIPLLEDAATPHHLF